jgi:hypothetical protein
VRAIRADPVLLLVSVRAEELDPARPVSVLIGELTRMPHAERLVLAPLDHAGVAALVEAISGVAPSARLTGRLVQRAAGNPFFTEELLAAGPDALTLPPAVGDVLAARVARLPAAGQRVLGAAAVLGREVSDQLLAAVAESVDLDHGLAAAVSHRLLEPCRDGYRFRHPLIQETVYGRLLPATGRHCTPAPRRPRATAPARGALRPRRPRREDPFHWQRAASPARRWRLRSALETCAGRARPTEALAQYTLAIEGWQRCRTRRPPPASTRPPCERAAEARPRPATTPAPRNSSSALSCIDAEKSLGGQRCCWSGWADSAGSPGTGHVAAGL